MLFFLDQTPRVMSQPYPLRMIGWQPEHLVRHHNRVVETLLLSVCTARKVSGVQKVNGQLHPPRPDVTLTILLPGTRLETQIPSKIDELLFSYHIPVGKEVLKLGLCSCSFSWTPRLQAIFDSIQVELEQVRSICVSRSGRLGKEGIGMADRLDLLALQFFLEIKLSADSGAAMKSADRSRFADMTAWLVNHVGESPDMEAFYRRFHTSRSVFYREWKRHFSLGIHQYLMSHRIQQAQKMLATTDLALSEISAKCGFHSLSYFHQAFRKATGRTPSEFRTHGDL